MSSNIDMAGYDNAQIFEKMQVGEPLKRYRKTILGKVFVYYLDLITEKINGKLLVGNPRRGDEGCFISTWTAKDDVFFKNANRMHFETGRLVEVSATAKVAVKEKSVNDMTDDELVDLVNSKGFFTLQSKLNKMTSVITVSRLLDTAEQQEKSSKIINAIKARLSELQQLELEGKLEE